MASYNDLIGAYAPAGSLKAVQDAGASHYISDGSSEGRTTTFNGLDYVASYGDLIKAFGADNDAGAYHYIEDGHSEGRTTTTAKAGPRPSMAWITSPVIRIC